MRYLSVCSGIEAASVAWKPLGWQPVAYAEIDPFASAVLNHHYPDVPNWGDITKFGDWPDATVDVLVGGTPCQSFSVAGFRKGMDDPRGNLALVYLAVADRYRARWLVWENVPGVFSSLSHDAPDPCPPPPPVDLGCDGAEVETEDEYDSEELHAFQCFLAGLSELGYGFAYRVLDAQHVRTCVFPGAVPQRRRRVFVVGYLGDWRPAAAVLFERHCLQGHSPPRREAGQRVAKTLTDGSEIARTLTRGNGHLTGGGQAAVAYDLRGREGGSSFEGPHDTANLRAASGGSSRSYVATEYAVRRLTPLECERLQGFPDGYTLIPYGNALRRAAKEELARYFERTGQFMREESPDNWVFDREAFERAWPRMAPDGPRYKALGNSMAVNVMQWIGLRIQHVEEQLRRAA